MKICKQCGAVIKPKTFEGKGYGQRKFCDSICARKYWRLKTKKKNNEYLRDDDDLRLKPPNLYAEMVRRGVARLKANCKLIISILVLCFSLQAHASIIDMQKIAQIESSGNPEAYNARSGATGKYQITKICLEDYNIMTKSSLTMAEMYDEVKCHKVADWYMSVRLPQLLRHYGLPVTVAYHLAGYNWGISHVRKWSGKIEDLPKETRGYYKLYSKLMKTRKKQYD